jgi:hypothetical protein
MTGELTHLDPQGQAHMVDVTHKEPTHREAIAEGHMRFPFINTRAANANVLLFLSIRHTLSSFIGICSIPALRVENNL